MASEPPVATLIGDVVGSRGAGDRPELHEQLAAVLESVNEELRPAVPLRITVGDEYQGVFDEVGQALVAAFRLRLHALPEVDLRHGIGWGPVTVLSESPRVEDGPGWWAAREAIEDAREQEHAALRDLRTSYRRAEGYDGPDPDPVNAALVCRDALLGAASSRSPGVLRGLLSGMSQLEIARAEGVSASAVSQRIRRDRLASLVATDELLGRVR